MRGQAVIPGELLPCFSARFSFLLWRSLLFLRAFVWRSGRGGGERRAVVWPVSCLVRGRAWPGGRTLACEGRAALARPLCAWPGPPALPGEGPVPGRWVKNRTERYLAPGRDGHGLMLPGLVARLRGRAAAVR